MIHRFDLLDPTALEKRSDYERKVIDSAQNAGNAPRHLDLGQQHTGALQQFIVPEAIKAAECDAPGCDGDISDGLASLAETMSFWQEARED